MSQEKQPPGNPDHRKTFHTLAGPVLFLAFVLMPIPSMTYEIRCSVGLLL